MDNLSFSQTFRISSKSLKIPTVMAPTIIPHDEEDNTRPTMTGSIWYNLAITGIATVREAISANSKKYASANVTAIP